jgi:DNA repair exonuclease SbcCD nuclease subunit
MSDTARPSLKILHTADVHLGDDLQPDSARRAFLAVLEQARLEKADLLIIAGDLFDSNRAARANVDFALDALGRLAMPVVLLPGNHDPYDERSVYREIDPQRRYGHVHVLRALEGELLRFPALSLPVWGRPVVEHTPDFRPLEHIPGRRDDGWHVAVAHGFHVPDGEEWFRSSPISDEAITRSAWDYLALGHIHPFRDVSRDGVVACYSGSPVRTSALEESTGLAALVELDQTGGVSVRPIVVAEQRRVAGIGRAVERFQRAERLREGRL